MLVIACGALARELLDIVSINGLDGVTVECLPVWLHNEPKKIPEAVRDRVLAARADHDYETIFVGYADCGTGGLLDVVCAEEGVERLAGAHCYEFFAGQADFAAMHEDDPASFYLTDYLVKHFERIVIGGLGLDRHPQLRDAYFGNYHRLVYLAQTGDPALVAAGKAAADRLGLAFEHRPTGYGELEPTIVRIAGRTPATTTIA